jgi:hypothetical protein
MIGQFSVGCFVPTQRNPVKPRQFCWRNRARCLIAVSVCLFLWGCAGATRLPTRARSPLGTTIDKKEIDLGFLQVGTTHREEVANKLAAIDTSYSNPRLFWGRWSESRWGYWWVVAAPCTSNCAAGDAKRLWHVQNVLVAFGENGVVTSREMIKDDKALWQALHSRMVEAPPPPLDFSQPIRLVLLSREPGTILLNKDGMEFEHAPSDGKKPNVQLSVLKVVRFSHGATRDKKTSPGATCHALEFSERTVFGKKIKFCANADQVGTLFQYLQGIGPPGMKWQ